MKDILVLIASVILGIALAAMVLSYGAKAQKATDKTLTGIDALIEQLDDDITDYD